MFWTLMSHGSLNIQANLASSLMKFLRRKFMFKVLLILKIRIDIQNLEYKFPFSAFLVREYTQLIQ